MEKNELLWDQLRQGNQKAIEDLYRLNYQVLYSYAFKVCRKKELAKDCVQELFVRLWEKRKELNKVSRVRAYLIQSVWHILIKELRKENRRLLLDENAQYDIDVVFPKESLLIGDESKMDKKKTLDSAIQSLSKRTREIVFMQYYEGLTIKEIHQITGLKIQSIKNTTYRAMISLREYFDKKNN